MALAEIISNGRCGGGVAKSGKKARNHSALQVLGACCVVALIGSPATAAQDRLDYHVSHSIYGDIGTYSNVVERDGQTTMVTSTLDVKVSILGMVAYRRSAHRVETWMGDRLVDFQSTSHLNGKTIALSGAAEGDDFVLTSSHGKLKAPASVRVANPWTTNNLNGDTILSPDDGAIHKGRLTDAGETSVTIGAQNIRVHEYDIALIGTAKHYQVWFDPAGTPVMFRLFDTDGICTFTLDSPRPPDVLLAQKARNPQQGTP